MTPPNVNLFIEVALLRLGKEIVDGLDHRDRTIKAGQIIHFWNEVGKIDDLTRDRLLQCWHELLVDAATRDREIKIRRTEGRTDTEDVHREMVLLYTNFCGSVSDCLDTLSAA